jgi:hypothetical protein
MSDKTAKTARRKEMQKMLVSIVKQSISFWQHHKADTGHAGLKLFATGFVPCLFFTKIMMKQFVRANFPKRATKGGK